MSTLMWLGICVGVGVFCYAWGWEAQRKLRDDTEARQRRVQQKLQEEIDVGQRNKLQSAGWGESWR